MAMKRKENKDPIKKGGIYSKTGCLRCKSSHKKCDETKPSCIMCLKRNKSCEYMQFQFFRGSPHSSHSSSSDNNHSLEERSPKIINKKAKSTVLKKSAYGTTFKRLESELFSSSDKISSSVFFPRMFMEMKDILNLDLEMQPVAIESDTLKNMRQNLNIMLASWRKLTWNRQFQMLKEMDPLKLKSTVSAETQGSEQQTKSENEILDDFVLTVTSWTIMSRYCATVPTNKLFELWNAIEQLQKNYELVRETMKFTSSTFMANTYEKNGDKDKSVLWNICIRVSTFRSALKSFDEILYEKKDKSFRDYVAVIFSLFLLFSINLQQPSSDWSTHLLKIHDLILEAKICFKNKQTSNVANKFESLFIFLKTWFLNINRFAHIESDQGGIITGDFDLADDFPAVMVDKNFSLSQKYNLAAGYSVGLQTVLKKIVLKLISLREKDAKLSGYHIIQHRLKNLTSNKNMFSHQFGHSLIKSLKEISKKMGHELAFDSMNHDSELNELKNSIRDSNQLWLLGIELFVRFFFLDCKDFNKAIIKDLLIEIVKTLYAIPHYHFNYLESRFLVYYSVLICKAIGDESLESDFEKIVDQFSANGFFGISQSFEAFGSPPMK